MSALIEQGTFGQRGPGTNQHYFCFQLSIFDCLIRLIGERHKRPGSVGPQGRSSRANKGERMSLHIEQEQTGDVAVLRFTGRMVRPDALCVLREAVTGLSDARVIVLDLSDVPMVGARGLGTLVFLHKWACANGIQLKLVNPSRLVRKLLEVTGLTSVLHISAVNDLIQMFCNSERAIEYVEHAAA